MISLTEQESHRLCSIVSLLSPAKLMRLRVLLFTLFLTFYASSDITAQSDPTLPGNTHKDKSAGDADDPTQNSSHKEMLKKLELKREEGDYKEHIARARENAQLAFELHEAFAHQKTLQGPDLKKLSRMEKLSRQIRNNAGGEENKDELKESPQQVEAALERLTELSAELQKKVESTPRQVVSASIIKCANEVVELVRYIRTLYR